MEAIEQGFPDLVEHGLDLQETRARINKRASAAGIRKAYTAGFVYADESVQIDECDDAAMLHMTLGTLGKRSPAVALHQVHAHSQATAVCRDLHGRHGHGFAQAAAACSSKPFVTPVGIVQCLYDVVRKRPEPVLA